MQTKPVIGLVLSFAVAFAMLGGSGFAADVFGEDAEGHETTEVLDQVAEQAEEEDAVSADVGGDNEPTLVGMVISGGLFVVDLVVAVGLLPFTLMNLGFPSYVAMPIGSLAYIVGLIGLYQFVGRTEYL